MGPVRDRLIVAAAASLAALGASACRRERPGLEPRHVMLVTIEDLRADRCSFLMHDRPTTWIQADERMRLEERAFGLDDIASDGVAFARCFAPSPVAAVSLATILSGRAPLEHGVLQAGDALPGALVTLPEAFRAGGFRTAAFVSGATSVDASFLKGFEVRERHGSDLAAARAASAWLGRDPGAGERTFTWVHLTGLVPPWTPREPVAEADAILEGRVFVDPEYAGPVDGSAESFRRVNAGEIAPDDADADALERLYEQQIARTSAVLWQALHETYDFHGAAGEASETWPRTLFVAAGTNGFDLLEQGAIGPAGSLSDAALHVPLVVRHPDSLTGERIFGDVVALEDVAPTLVEWLRLPPLPGARGRSLLAVTDSYVARELEERPAIAQLPDRGVFSARDVRWRLVWNPLRTKVADRPPAARPIGEVALYEIDADPDCAHDVAAEHPDVVARLTAAIRAWRETQRVFPVERPRAGPPR